MGVQPDSDYPPEGWWQLGPAEDLKLQEKLLADSILTFSSRLAVLLREISEKTIPKKLVKLDQAMGKDQNASGKKVIGDDA